MGGGEEGHILIVCQVLLVFGGEVTLLGDEVVKLPGGEMTRYLSQDSLHKVSSLLYNFYNL